MTVLVISVSILQVSATLNETSGVSEPIETGQTFDNAEKHYFNLSCFRGAEEHDFKAHREIHMLKYGGVVVNTTYYLNIAEDADDTFNAVNFTYRNEEFASIFQYKFIHLNGSTTGFSVEEDKQANCTIISVLMPNVTAGNEFSLSFIVDYGTYVKQDAGRESDDKFYGLFNHSFHPWVSLPLTNYSVYLDIEGSVGEEKPEIVESSIEPSGIGTGNYTIDVNAIQILNVSCLPTCNLSLLNDSMGYNLTALQDIDFIPAYDREIGENLTLFLSFNYSTNYPPIQYDYIHRTIEIDQWKLIKVTEEIQVRNLAGNSSEFSIEGKYGAFIAVIPRSAQYQGGHDEYGNLSANLAQDVYYTHDIIASDLRIFPRNSIGGNETYKFKISYTHALKDVIKGDVFGTQQLSTWSSSWFNWTVIEFSLKVVLPLGSSFKSSSEFFQESIERKDGSKSESLFGLINRPYREWTFTNITQMSNTEIRISYDAGFMWIAGNPMIYSFGFLLLGLAYVGVRSIRFGEGAVGAIEEIPYELIEDFVRTYEEKTAIRERVRRLERQRKSGKATDREYKKARRILQNKFAATERELVGLTRSLAKKSRTYEGYTHSIEVSEAEREDVLTNLERLEKRKTQGRIGKDAYRRLKINYERRMKKANNSLDRVLIELRSLIPK